MIINCSTLNHYDNDSKLKLQKTLFPDGINISKQNKRVRTNRVNSIFALIQAIAKLLKENKNGKKSNQILEDFIYSKQMIE